MQENILEIKNLSKYFGGLAAVSDCSLKIKKGTITGIIGPNGSGKTTLFNLIAGNLKSSAGSVMFNNEDITDVPSYELFSKGLPRTFQIKRAPLRPLGGNSRHGTSALSHPSQWLDGCFLFQRGSVGQSYFHASPRSIH